MDERTKPLNADALLGELRWLRRLARSLVGSVGIEDDLVQETWLAASRVQGEVSRAWLVGTISKLAARWFRGEARLAQREKAVAKPEALDIGAHLGRNELLATLLAELRSLDEPFRATLLLLYQEGLSVQDVAARLNAPEDTIRWRRREGLIRLRNRLDGASDRGPDWRAAFLPSLALPSAESSGTLPTLGASVGSFKAIGASVVIWKTVIAVSLSVAAWWLIRPALDAPADAPRGVSVAEAVEDTLGDMHPPSPEGLAPVTVREGRSVVTAELNVASVDTSPQGPMVEVRVVDAKERPVIGARVWVGETPDPGLDSRSTNAEGVARLPASLMGKVNRISAMTTELYGVASYLSQIHGDECSLMLFPDGDVRVLIVGSDDQPIEGVPVGLVHGFSLRHRPDVRNLRFDGVVRTNASGVGVIRHVRTPAMFQGGSREIQVGPAVLLGLRPDVTLDALELPREPVRVVLPATGSLAVQVLESGGKQSHVSGTLRLAIDASSHAGRDLGDLEEQLRFSPQGRVSVEFEQGVGFVPFIGLDLPLIAGASDVEPTDSTIGVGPGPSSRDVSGTLVLKPSKSAPEIAGVLVGDSGEPLALTPIKLSVRIAGKVERTGATAQTLTDERGGFRIHVNDEVREAWKRTHVHQLQVFVESADPLEPLTAGVTLPVRLELGENDIGSLRCVSSEPLLRGRALGPDDEPVLLTASDLEFRIGVGEDPASFRFLDHARFAVDRERFALFAPDPELGRASGESFYITASREGYPWLRQEVLPGVSNVELKFEPGARIAGAVVMEAGQSPVHCSGKFYCEDPNGVERPYGRSTFLLNGNFTLEDVPHRRGRFVIRGAGSSKALATFEYVLPSFEVSSQDPRLAAIDLRADVHAYDLRIVGQGGNLLEGVSLRLQGEARPETSFLPGLFNLRRAENQLQVELSGSGLSPLSRTLAPGEHVITMEPSPEVLPIR